MGKQTGVKLDEFFNFVTYGGEVSCGDINEQNVIVCLKSSRGAQVLNPTTGENIDKVIESNITNASLTVKVNSAVKSSGNSKSSLSIKGEGKDRTIELKLK